MDCWSKIFYMVDAVPNSQPAACENTEYMIIFILFVTSDKFIVVVNYYSVVRCTTILSDIQHGFLMSSSVIAFYSQPHYCYRPYFQQPGFDLLEEIMFIIHGLCWTVSRQVKAHVVLTCSNGVSQSPSCGCGQRQTMNQIVDINKIWMRTESTPRNVWWCSHAAGIKSDCSTREVMIIIVFVHLKASDRLLERSNCYSVMEVNDNGTPIPTPPATGYVIHTVDATENP